MKQFFSVAAVAVCLLIFTNADAKILRVGYAGPKTNSDYSDLQTAVDNCSPSKVDTIFLYPGNWLATYDKKIVTIGYGYYIDTATLGTGANKGLQNIIGSNTADLRLTDGATGCIFEGIDGMILRNLYNVADNITIKRCNGAVKLDGYADGSTVLSNWNFLQSDLNIKTYSSISSFSILFQKLLVNNCIIQGFTTSLSTAQTGMLTNNVFVDNWYDPSFVFKNNIFLYSGNFTVLSSSHYDYNIFVGTLTGGINGSHNKISQNPDAIFLGYTNQNSYSNDARWQLKSNSPAKGFGEGGIDCGIYAAGSTYPYKPSGIPAIPAFYRLDAPSSTTGGTPTYQITFSVRGNN